ncbi:MAG: YbfB/YjiJ family MFS transporter [Rhodospirillales bacterium]|nr:YbfB/YjiJ family MFS transporter [Rhodospirillales bacterium]
MPPQSQNLRIPVVGMVALALAMGVGRFAFTPLLPLMLEDGLLGITDGGYLASIHFLGYWLGAVSAAKLPLPPKMMLRLSLLAIGVGTLGMGVTNNFIAWLILRWLCGVCSAWTLVLVSNYYIKHLADNGRADYQGWVFSGVGTGILIVGLGCLAFMVTQIGSSLSWQIVGAISLIAIGAVCLNLGPEIPAVRFAVPKRESQRSPLDWRIVIAYGAMGIGYIIPATYLPVMAREIVQSPLIFGWGWPVFGAAAFVSTLLAARLQKGFSNRQIWTASQVIMAIGLLLPVFHPHIFTIITAGFCVGGTFMIITMAGMKEAHRIASPQDVMRHIGAMTTAFATGQMIGPVFAGTVYGLTQSFAVSLVITSATLVISAMVLAGRTSKKEVVQS